MFKEFKEFALKGNVMDLAVAVVLGAAFGAIIKSFVDDLINPLAGVLLGGTDLSNFYLVLGEGGELYPSLDAARTAGVPVFAYGAFLNTVVNFVIIAVGLFLVIKVVNAFRRAEESATHACPRCTTEISKDASRCPACTSEVAPVPAPTA